MRVKTDENYQIDNGDNQAQVGITYVDHTKRTYADYVDIVVKNEKGDGSELARLTFDFTTTGLAQLKEFALTIQEVIQLLESKL
jgi:hypothetical protein